MSDKKSSFKIKYVISVSAVIVLCLGMVFMGSGKRAYADGNGNSAAPTATPTPVPELVTITARYDGTTVLVGREYDRTKLIVTAHYSNGTSKVLEDYEVSSTRVEQKGANNYIVIAEKKTASFVVVGKQLSSISAICKLDKCSAGNFPALSDFIVTAYYSDGSIEKPTEGYKVSPDSLTSVGLNSLTITYGDCSTQCFIHCLEPQKPISLAVSYNKSSLTADTPVSRSDLMVVAMYPDGSAETINTYTILPESFAETGKQKFTVGYGGILKDVEVEVTVNTPLSLRAEYIGEPVLVGRDVKPEDFKAVVRYVNGVEKETADFTIKRAKIRYIGDNTIKLVYADKIEAEVVVPGTEIDEPDFDYASEQTVKSGSLVTSVKTAIPRFLEKDCLKVKVVKRNNVKKAYRKLLLPEGKYMAFSYNFADDDNEDELPVTVRITIPEQFDMDTTYLYYLPTKTTILGRTNKTVIDENTFEVDIFKTGTYMLVHSEYFEDEAAEEPEEEDDEEDDDEEDDW